jgi:hypothetical protein
VFVLVAHRAATPEQANKYAPNLLQPHRPTPATLTNVSCIERSNTTATGNRFNLKSNLSAVLRLSVGRLR